MCVLIKDYSADLVKRIRTNQAVLVRRGSAHHDPMIVEVSKWSADYSPSLGRQFSATEFQSWLLTLWGEQVLTDYFNRQEVTKGDIIPEPVIDHEQPPDDLDPMYVQAWRRASEESRKARAAKDQKDPASMAELPLVPFPSNNGKHGPQVTDSDK